MESVGENAESLYKYICNGTITNGKFITPVTSRWWWVGSRVHTAAARANSTLDARTSHVSPRSCMNSQPISSRATSQSLPPSLAVQAASAHSRVQKASATQLTFLSNLAHALCAKQFASKQGVFGHRAIWINWGLVYCKNISTGMNTRCNAQPIYN